MTIVRICLWQPTSACGAPLWMKMVAGRVSALCAQCITLLLAIPFS